jgi:hypothetical protein
LLQSNQRQKKKDKIIAIVAARRSSLPGLPGADVAQRIRKAH